MSKIKQNSNQSLGYKGDLKIQIRKGNKVIKTKNIKNSGRYPLFQFFIECLNGNYDYANKFKPEFLQIFYTDKINLPKDDEWETIDNHGENTVNMSTFFNSETKKGLRTFTYYSLPELELDAAVNDQIGSASITYKFLIPFSHIKKQANQVKINALALYSKNNVNTLSNPSTYVFISDEENKFINLIEDITSEISDKDYNIYIEWKLMILNSN